MDNIINVVPEVTEKTRVCECCGQTLPLDAFPRKGKGYKKICKKCSTLEVGTSERFKAFTSRELIDELIRRGYKGSLKLVVVKEFKL